jgi:hypothetical protein
LDEQGEQLLAAGGQRRERLAQRRVALGLDQFVPGCLRVVVRDGRGVG